MYQAGYTVGDASFVKAPEMASAITQITAATHYQGK
jgi:hypothetical protein